MNIYFCKLQVVPKHCEFLPKDFEHVDLDLLSRETDGFNGAELMAVTVEAGMQAIRHNRSPVRAKDFAEALSAVRRGREQPEARELPPGMYL